MKMLEPDETALVGKWTVANGIVTCDETCARIDHLVTNLLKEVARDDTGWDVLYRDPEDGRYWELIYPMSHMHGGGPPTLRLVGHEQAESKYHVR